MRRCLLCAIILASAVVLWLIPGEAIVQLGLRKVVLEQGVAMAMRHQSWEAAPDAEPNPIAAPIVTAKRGRK